MTPFKQAMCTKDESGKYCAAQATSPSAASNANVDVALGSSSSSVSSLKNYLWSTAIKKRAAAQTPVIAINETTFRASNLLFFFLKPDTPSAQLCTTCARSVMMSFITFETNVPYAPGLAQSPLMGGQGDLYNGMTSTCGKSFFSGAVQAAGGISGGLTSAINAAPRSVGQSFNGVIGAVMGTLLVAGATYVL